MTTLKILPLLFLMCAFAITGCATDNPPVPTTDEADFTPLFDGQSLAGWTVVGGEASFDVDNGEIVGTSENATKNTFLRTVKAYDNFEFRCQFKWDRPGNSGIQFRSHQRPAAHPRNPKQVYGYQYELDSSARAWSGGLYEEGRRGWLVNLDGEKNAFKREAVNLQDWNDIVIECRGNRIRTWLNGVSIVNHEDLDGNYPLPEGFFGLQVHAGGTGQVRWRNLRIKELRIDD